MMQKETSNNDIQRLQKPLTQRRKRINTMIGLALFGIVVLLFAVTIVRLTEAWV
jgi:hypothetical protein